MRETPISIEVFAAHHVRIVDGVLRGEMLGHAGEMVLDDTIAIDAGAVPQRLDLISAASGLRRKGSTPTPVHLDCCLTLMAPDGSTHDALVLVEAAGAAVVGVYLMALGDLTVRTRYRLVGVSRDAAALRFAQAADGSFARGTRITLASGDMRPIDALAPGDLVLTRDAGAQPVRHITQATLRAVGPFAPVVITRGALHNVGDLVLRPDHRIFVYQRSDALGAGRSEVLIKARQLVNDVTILRRKGGFIDYFQLILDDHQIIYAEGIAAESHLVDAQSRAALPSGLAAESHATAPHRAYQVDESVVDPRLAADILRRASTT